MSRTGLPRGFGRRGAVSAVALACAGALSTAHAQEAATAPAAGAAPAAVGEIVVTGSRLTIAGFTAPTPVTVLSGATMQTLNLTNVGDAISQLPSFRASNTPTTNGFGSFNVGAQIVNLYSLGVNRSLVLVDGRRLPPVTREFTVDLNQIPSDLVERTDVVTGGASAAYGSDAVAGAVNIILNKKLTGIRGQADYGVSQTGDGGDYHISLAGGSDFLGGKGHFVIGGEWEDQNGIGNCFTRDWCKPTQVVTNAGVDSVPGQPAFVRADNNAGWFANTNGVISLINNSTPATAGIRNLFGTGGVTFTPSGTPVAYTLGAPGNGNSVVGGMFTPSQNFTQLLVPVERHAIYAHADYDVSESLRTFGEVNYAHVWGQTQQSPYFGTPISIFADNPYIPAALRGLVGPAPATPSATRPANTAAVFNLAILGQRRGVSTSEADSYRVAVGFDARLNARWSVNGYYQFGHTDRDQSVANDLVVGAGRVINSPTGGISNAGSYAYFPWATDVVASPGGAGLPAAGTPICRALISPDPALRAAAQGCSPYNPFGAANTSQDALNYVYRTLTENIVLDQHAVAGNVQAELLDLPAGPLAATAGFEYRHDYERLVHDPLSQVFAYFQNFGADYNAHDDVIEGYAEAQVPIVKDLPLANSLSFDGAVRQAHYDIAGFGSFNQVAASTRFDSTTWKVGLVYDMTDWLRFRGSISRDVRAPNLYDLFQASASNFTSVVNRFVGGTNFPASLAGGNPDLVPEKATTNTYGFVLQPKWGWSNGLRLSADYFDIRVDDYIGTTSAQNTVDQCYYYSNQQMCGLIKFGPGQQIIEIDTANINLQWLRAQGWNVEADYRLPLSRFSTQWPGALTLRLLATDTLNSSTNVFGNITNQAGATLPRWVLNTYGTYENGPLAVTLQARYISPGVFDPTKIGPGQTGYAVNLPNSINDNFIDGIVYLNLNASYDVIRRDNKKLQLFLSVRNLLDAAPPTDPQLAYSTNPAYFDQIGRYFRVGFRFTY